MNILIVKLGALGDVLRTTPLLTGLRKRYPGCRVSWLVDERSADVLTDNPAIDGLFTPSEAPAVLGSASFDLAINLDKDEEALDAVMAARASRKAGFGRTPEGALCALDGESEYACRLGIDDDLKFRKNQKTYQEISFEQAGLKFEGEEYLLPLSDEDARLAREHLAGLGAGSPRPDKLRVGLNTGSGARFAGKRLPVESFVELVKMFYTRSSATIFLLGGEEETERNRRIEKLSPYPVINTGSHPIKRFAAIVRECDLVISGDTTAMHVAIAVKTPVVAYFASTCAAEIELYGRGRKVVSGIPCAPCYLRHCPINEQCMEDMEPEIIFKASKEVLNNCERVSR